MADILVALKKKRKAQMEHTALIVLAVQRSAGNKQAQFFNPYAVDSQASKAAFKQLVRGNKK